MTKSRGILRPRHRWLEADIDALRRLYPDHTAPFCARVLGVPVYLVYARAKQLGLKKSAEFLASPASGRLDGKRGSATRFQKGNRPERPFRKGVHASPGTEFRKGLVPANVQEVGALRINSMGDIDIKVAPGKNQWVSLRRYVWETEVGPIPSGMCVAARKLKLPAGKALLALPKSDRSRISSVMRDLRSEANAEAEKAWARRKGPMAAYWRAVSTYARHVANALDQDTQ